MMKVLFPPQYLYLWSEIYATHMLYTHKTKWDFLKDYIQEILKKMTLHIIHTYAQHTPTQLGYQDPSWKKDGTPKMGNLQRHGQNSQKLTRHHAVPWGKESRKVYLPPDRGGGPREGWAWTEPPDRSWGLCQKDAACDIEKELGNKRWSHVCQCPSIGNPNRAKKQGNHPWRTHGSASSHTEKKGKEELVASGRNTALIALFKLQHLKYLLISLCHLPLIASATATHAYSSPSF